MQWIGVDTQAELDALDTSVCWEDARVLEYYTTPALYPGMPDDVSRSGYDHPNVYVLVDAGGPTPRFLELALLHCDRIGADAFNRLHLSGRIDALKRLEVVSGDGTTLLRCARLAYRRLDDVDQSGHYYTVKLSEGDEQ